MWMLFLVSALLGVSGSEVAPSAASQQLQALHCPPCERIHCSTRRALKLQCRGGVTTGVCGCCPVCARTEGETSCSSCLLLKPPSCPQTCASSDSSCLHRFGKCVHHHLTAPHSPVCHNNLNSLFQKDKKVVELKAPRTTSSRR